jgi:CRP/FNR family transcriptional regulator, cyclic AMP receptor protein
VSIIDLLPSETPLKALPEGQVVFAQGDPGDVMYVVIDGEVDILLDGKLIETVRSGGVVGEVALIDSGPRSATAISRTRCLLSPVDERRFIDLICREPEFALTVMRVLARRLRRMDVAH